MKKYILIVCGLLLTTQVLADPVVTFKFDTPEREALFHKLGNELRCLVCQNQSIADSNAGLAKDLRTEIYEMIEAGKSESQIIDFMVARYGDYVLYRPPFKLQTALLWLGPMLVFLLGVFFALKLIRGQRKVPADTEISASERARLHDLQAQSRDLK